MSKIIALHVDGLDCQMIRERIKKGKLKNLKDLEKKSVFGTTPHKLIAPEEMAWGVFLTGKNPGSFGFWDRYYRSDNSNHISEKKVTSESLKITSLVDYLPKNGKVASFIDVPLLEPVQKIHAGFCISLKDDSEKIVNDTWPKELKDEIQRNISIDKETKTIGLEDNLEKQIIDKEKLEIVDYLIKNKNSDLITIHLNGIIKICEYYYEKKETNKSIDTNYFNALDNYYIFIDEKIGELSNKLNEDDSLLVFSASSAIIPDGFINLNKWLKDEGYLSLKKEIDDKQQEINEDIVNWKETRAWSVGNCGHIYINLEGKEKDGIVKEDEYFNLTNEIIKKLRQLQLNGKKELTLDARLRENTSFGEKEYLGPDIFVSYNDGKLKTSSMVNANTIYEDYNDAKNYPNIFYGQYNNYFLIKTPGINYTGEIEKVKFPNLMPTILDLLEIGIPYEMQQSIKKLVAIHYEKSDFTESTDSDSEIKKIGLDSKATGSSDKQKDHEEVDDEAEQKVMSRLESLGY